MKPWQATTGRLARKALEAEMPVADGDLQAVLLGALLHDVGKLYQRSGLSPAASYQGFTAEDYGAHGAHAKWSADFVQRHVADRWALSPHDILTHHQPIPASRVAKLIALADRMSAGEREEHKAEQPRPWESQLLSVFSRLEGPRTAPEGEGYHALVPLELSRSALFPRTERMPSERCRESYLRLWQGFETDFSRLDRHNFDRYLEAAYHLLQRYGWCVPSAAYHTRPDVSLFDHSRLTCAIATCLHLDGLGDPQLDRLLAYPPQEPDRSQPLLLLVGGDLSGLQDFLYTLSAEGAARTLRGRSFYLQLLTESAARFILTRLGLPTANAIYWGGGHFYLLAPISGQKELEDGCAELEQTMLELHRGDLGLAIGSAPLSVQDFEREQFAEKWGEVGIRIGEAKSRRFSRVVQRSYHLLFAPTGGGTGARCEACHAEMDSARGMPRCDACRGMEELGLQVARAAAARGALLSVGDQPSSGDLSWWQMALGRFGCWWDFGPGGEGALRYTLNETDFVAAGADGFRWMPAVVPKAKGESDQGRAKDFTEIARDSIGVERLGVLRMDVDDLGSLFLSGLGHAATASRVASLSSALRLFFEGWINRLAPEVEADQKMVPTGRGGRSGLIYGVYSGGDDLFVVGAWDRIPLLARRIRSDLEAFAAGNPAVRISAGIALVDPHLPLYRAAEDAHRALELGSKEHRRPDGPPKDAVTFLGETLGWEEFDRVQGEAAELARLVGQGSEGGKAPRSLLSTLSALHALYRREAARQAGRQGIDPDRLYYGRWTWMAAYGLGRARERASDHEARSALAALHKRLAEPWTIRTLGLVARWAEYLTRSREVGR